MPDSPLAATSSICGDRYFDISIFSISGAAIIVLCFIGKERNIGSL